VGPNRSIPAGELAQPSASTAYFLLNLQPRRGYLCSGNRRVLTTVAFDDGDSSAEAALACLAICERATQDANGHISNLTGKPVSRLNLSNVGYFCFTQRFPQATPAI
jgi:hypothetical protein